MDGAAGFRARQGPPFTAIATICGRPRRRRPPSHEARAPTRPPPQRAPPEGEGGGGKDGRCVRHESQNACGAGVHTDFRMASATAPASSIVEGAPPKAGRRGPRSLKRRAGPPLLYPPAPAARARAASDGVEAMGWARRGVNSVVIGNEDSKRGGRPTRSMGVGNANGRWRRRRAPDIGRYGRHRRRHDGPTRL